MKLMEFVPEFAKALEAQLTDDDKRWGNTWLRRTRKGQTERTIQSYRDYIDQYEQAGVPIPWLQIAGDAMIAWLRETGHPELWPE